MEIPVMHTLKPDDSSHPIRQLTMKNAPPAPVMAQMQEIEEFILASSVWGEIKNLLTNLPATCKIDNIVCMALGERFMNRELLPGI
jgi:hypothetical protein